MIGIFVMWDIIGGSGRWNIGKDWKIVLNLVWHSPTILGEHQVPQGRSVLDCLKLQLGSSLPCAAVVQGCTVVCGLVRGLLVCQGR